MRHAGLFDPAATRSSCGVGALVELKRSASHDLVEDAFQVLVNLDHRGARGAEEKTGDGAGMLLQLPHEFFSAQVPALDQVKAYGVGQVFFPRETEPRRRFEKLIEQYMQETGLRLIDWREVPTRNEGLGDTALASEPAIRQFFVTGPAGMSAHALDTRLYVLRRQIEHAVNRHTLPGKDRFYICSLSRRTIVYKGLLTCAQLRRYFPDLADPRVKSRLVLVHSRFSTNTLGAWHLAHPYRTLLHNGEINTLRGNLNWMRARETDLASERFGPDIDRLIPVTGSKLSDSAVLDNVLELLLESGRSLPRALRMLIPEAWEKDPLMPTARKAFYDFYSTLMEPWDGPALVVATDGERVAAILDRNGLRPCRYTLTRSGRLVMASETGVLDITPGETLAKGRLKPGQLLVADPGLGRILPEPELFGQLCRAPYRQWLEHKRLRLADLLPAAVHEFSSAQRPHPLACYQVAFAYTAESLQCLMEPMAETGRDPVGSMGNDTPLAFLSSRNRTLFQYFHQLFAQVSNPPIDYIRESLVTSLACHVGRRGNLLTETDEHCRQLLLQSPILTAAEIEAIRHLDRNGIRAAQVDMTYPKPMSLMDAVERLRAKCVEAIAQGYEILVLTDTAIDANRIAIPALLATGAVHHHLVRKGLRTRAALVLESGQPHSVHHFCVLIGYGADAVYPWLAYESLEKLVTEGAIGGRLDTAITQYKKALEGGLFKVMAKMGISTLASYKGAQVFESVGLNPDFVQEYFEGTRAQLAGVGMAQVKRDLNELHDRAFRPRLAGSLPLDPGGDLYWRREGEWHQWNPLTIGKLQQAACTGDEAAYRDFSRIIDDHSERLQTLRGLLDFKPSHGAAVALSEVEPVEEILKRFSTGSMSFGALSQEAHETLATAMNRIGGKSGTGEGGEQTERFGSERECSMKQVASGRFGVTSRYLVQAKQIEIKMAQGSKPGEGGELPADKVDEGIAAVRFTVPGVGLISPPPHHDIYSIEDLAQLIHDLKCANPLAEIHVKLVATGGVGTIAAGVAKARADAVLISGDSGGTGASVKTSIKSAGSPWELGLAETQQVLLANNLRSRIRVRVDGGLKTGRDVVVAALLGAEEFGFGTAALVTLGCVMLRKCHCNTCSVGVATQDPGLRKRFTGKPEHLVNYLVFVANEVRELMAVLGYRRMDDMIGQVDRLYPRKISHPKGTLPELSALLQRPPTQDTPRKTREQDHHLERQLDLGFMEKAEPAIEQGQPVVLHTRVRNRDRAVGTLLSSVVTRRRADRPLDDDTIRVECNGCAGQSFGAFLTRGLTLYLEGEANDYAGKGLSGGKLIVKPPVDAAFAAEDNVIVGNVVLYGATAGEAYFNGIAGERFGVRNSGAMSVVEGVGDHGCEYMTGGVVLILGNTGKNFAAGMSGGEAFIFDEAGDFGNYLNSASVRMEPCVSARDRLMVRRLLENHRLYTDSAKAWRILAAWDDCVQKFVKVIPDAYAAVLERSIREGKDIRPAPPPRPRQIAAA